MVPTGLPSSAAMLPARRKAAAFSPVVALALALVTGSLSGAQAQIYTFQNVPLPESKSLHTMYSFYIYSHRDAPDRSLGQPFVKFHSLVSHSTSSTRTDEDLKDYDGIQLSILPFTDFWRLISPEKFCATAADAQAGLASHPGELLVHKGVGQSDTDVNFYSHTVRFHLAKKDHQISVHETGVYILLYSNCGEFTEATVSGSVVVKNSYGFLPGNEYHKMPFYGWLSLIYGCVAAAWMIASFRYWRELFHIQYCIAVVIALGLFESFFWWVFFNEWNNSGIRPTFLFVMSILSSVVKSCFSYILVLVASLGWGVTRPYLDQRTIVKVQAICFLYIVLGFIRETVLSFRHSHSLSLAFVTLCLLPVALLNGGIFYWIFTSLSSLMSTLRDRKQDEKVRLFERLWFVLVAALSCASLSLVFQIVDLHHSISGRWHYQWFFADGVSHLLFLLVLGSMMYLWAPHKNSKRYAYVPAGEKDEEEAAEADARSRAAWAQNLEEEDEDDDDEDASFWAATHKAPADTGGVKKKGNKGETVGASEVAIE